mgnify:CR=1 FL=1
MLRLAEGVTRSRIIGRNGLVETIRLSITPTANRNSYRVARLVGALPRVACLPATLGWGIATLSELLLLAETPPQALPKGRERIIAEFE